MKACTCSQTSAGRLALVLLQAFLGGRAVHMAAQGAQGAQGTQGTHLFWNVLPRELTPACVQDVRITAEAPAKFCISVPTGLANQPLVGLYLGSNQATPYTLSGPSGLTTGSMAAARPDAFPGFRLELSEHL